LLIGDQIQLFIPFIFILIGLIFVFQVLLLLNYLLPQGGSVLPASQTTLSWYPITNASFGVGCVNNFTNIYSVYIYFGSNVPSGPSEMTLIQNVTFGGLSSISYPTYK